ncbi:MAG: signal peptidase I [Eubacteriales bacterium]|nr:signal peptidase I [Eubacteriales bacterium]
MKKSFSFLIQIVMDIVIVASIIITFLSVEAGIRERKSGELGFICGYKPVYIVSGSMENTILKHSIVILKKAGHENVNAGDIITYKVGNTYVTHRLIGRDEEAFNNGEKKYLITKGDNNRINDIELLDPDDIKGKVVFIFNLPGQISKIAEKMKESIA